MKPSLIIPDKILYPYALVLGPRITILCSTREEAERVKEEYGMGEIERTQR